MVIHRNATRVSAGVWGPPWCPLMLWHPNIFTLDTAAHWGLCKTPTKCEIDQVYGCREIERQTEIPSVSLITSWVIFIFTFIMINRLYWWVNLPLITFFKSYFKSIPIEVKSTLTLTLSNGMRHYHSYQMYLISKNWTKWSWGSFIDSLSVGWIWNLWNTTDLGNVNRQLLSTIVNQQWLSIVKFKKAAPQIWEL